MDKAGNNKHGPTGRTLFRQIATRLAAFTLLFALLDVGIVISSYSSQPELLAQELLTLEAKKAEKGSLQEPDLLEGPPGAPTLVRSLYRTRPARIRGNPKASG